MGRPPLPIGTHGKIRHEEISPGRWRARCSFRDYDGHTRELERYDTSKTKAERRLKEALRDRARTQGVNAAITPDTRLHDAADLWWEEAEANPDLTQQTRDNYKRAYKRIKTGMGGRLIREVDVPACDRFIKTVKAEKGPSAARSARNVLSSMMGMVVRHGAMDENPVREIAKVTASRRKARPKSLSAEDLTTINTKLAADAEAVQLDVPDLVEVLAGTGMRVGEVLALRPEVVDLDAGVLEVNATAIRIEGRGAALQLIPKSAAGWRIIALPDHVVDVLRRRMATVVHSKKLILVVTEEGEQVQRAASEVGLLFPARTGGVRTSSNANKDIVGVLRRINKDAWAWITTHTFRKTVATLLDDAGFTARQIADHLGHENPSMTQDVYMGRSVALAAAANALAKTGGKPGAEAKSRRSTIV